jgi:cell division protein FtsX
MGASKQTTIGEKKVKILKNKKGTVSGLVGAFVTLLIFGALVNVFFPAVQGVITGLDPSFRFIIDIAFLVAGIGIIIEIYRDATRGESSQYG